MRYLTLLILTSWFTIGWAQSPIQISQTSLDFGNVFENAPDSLPLIFTNNGNETVNISEIRFYKTYKDYPFSIGDSVFSIDPDSSKTIFVKFAPVHNILHHSTMLIFSDAERGVINVPILGQGKYSKAYYNSTENKIEQDLKTALKSRITQGYNQLSYNAARDAMYMTIDNQKVNGQNATQNTLEGVYTGFTVTGYTSRTDAQNQGFNTEHTFPQGFFSQNLPMRSDLFHLFPTQQNANSQRGNLPFGVVTGTPSWQNGGSKKGSTKFEPRDKQKGPVARAMFYFVIRYQDYANHVAGQESILRQWHEDFPPNDISRRRNDDIEAVQNNRNPFIDYPQFLERINKIVGTSTAPVVEGIDLSETNIDYDTIPILTNISYQYAIVNTGNQELEVNNMSFGDNSLSFSNISGNDTTISPGMALSINITLNQAQNGSFQSTFDFQTNVTGSENVSIPVTAELVGNTRIEELIQPFSIFPNPASENLVLELEQPTQRGQVSLLDLNGRLLFTESLKGNSHEILVGKFIPGIYLVKLKLGEKIFHQRISIIR